MSKLPGPWQTDNPWGRWRVVDAGISPVADAPTCISIEAGGVHCGAVINEALQLVGEGGVVMLGPGVHEIEETIEVPPGRSLWGPKASFFWKGLRAFDLDEDEE